MSTTSLAMTPSGAASAYARTQGADRTGFAGAVSEGASGEDASGFGSTLQRAMESVVHTGHEADIQTAQGISGEGNITQVVMAVSRAQLALQSTVAVRDRVVQAYQDIMKMPI